MARDLLDLLAIAAIFAAPVTINFLAYGLGY